MAENKKSIIVYSDWQLIFNQLTDDEAGKLIKHFFSYVNDENPVIEDRLLRIVFEPIKQQLKRDLKKWEHISEKRKEAGKRSAEIKKQTATKSTNVESVEQTATKSTVNVTDTVNDNVTDNEINNKGGEFEKKKKEDMIVLEMMKVWNKYNPNYLTQDELDYSACLEMAYKIAKVKGWKKQTVLYEKQNDCVASWEKIVLFIRSDSFLKKLAVQNINNQFQMVIQKMTNPDEVKEVLKTERQNPTIKPVTEEMLSKYR